jgi:hypothetical protein
MSWDAEWGLARLVGQWRIVREIAGQGSMSGVAVFERMADGRVLYRESAELWLHNGTRLFGKQRYFYQAIDGSFAVYFYETGELFEKVRFAAKSGGEYVAAAQHLCKEDRYVSEYRFLEDGRFSIRHVVRGPRKDYVVETVYVKD